MNSIVTALVNTPLVPVPHVPITTRAATMADLPFLDSLQKQFGRALGYFPTKQFEGYIEMGAVLVAEEKVEDRGWRIEDGKAATEGSSLSSTFNPLSSPAAPATPAKLGYCISRDRYLKRDELGVIYQLCVAPGDQRKLIGASLLKAVFERSAYGCRLYCCWCAQDLAANYFWESMGFVPVAFRAGSTGKKRVHIFWQRRINREECGSVGVSACGSEKDAATHPDTPSPRHSDTPFRPTPYWYPCMTNSGAIRADRLVFPIPPGVRWQDVEAVAIAATESTRSQLPGTKQEPRTRKKVANDALTLGSQRGSQRAIISAGGLRFASVAPIAEEAKGKSAGACPGRSRRERSRRERSRGAKVDPALVSKARELRDRYLERVNDQMMLIGAAAGKYDVSRTAASAHVEERLIPRLAS